jgi:hypothetical protein
MRGEERISREGHGAPGRSTSHCCEIVVLTEHLWGYREAMQRVRSFVGFLGMVVGLLACGGGEMTAVDAGGRVDASGDGGRVDAGSADVGSADAATACSSAAECDDGNACTDDSCAASGACAYVPNAAVCRPAAGDCDVDEVCASGACPPDVLAPAAVVCRDAMDVCDAPESCTGSAAACPAHDPAVIVDCSDHDLCTADSCDAVDGCGSTITPSYARALLTGSPDGAHEALPIPTFAGSAPGGAYTICPDGPNPAGAPPSCIVEVDGSAIDVGVRTDDASTLELTGTVPLRVQLLPVDFTFFSVPGSTNAALNGSGACPGGSYAAVPMVVSIDRSAWPTVGVTLTPDMASIASAVQCCGGGASSSTIALIRPAVIQSIVDTLRAGVVATIEQQICLRSDPGPCPAGASAAADGLCRPDAAPTACIARSEGAALHQVAVSCIE